MKLSWIAMSNWTGEQSYIYDRNDPAFTVLATVPNETIARLIAAAPELLEAAKYALGSLEGAQDVCGDDKLWEGCCEELRAVIKKAEGK